MARNLAAGDGYSYAHVPSAFRAPGYAGVLAAMMMMFGEHYLIAVRCLQFGAGLAASWFALRAAPIWSGEASGRPAMVTSLIFPTLAHTPFVLNSRIRAPLVDPVVAVLPGRGSGGKA